MVRTGLSTRVSRIATAASTRPPKVLMSSTTAAAPACCASRIVRARNGARPRSTCRRSARHRRSGAATARHCARRRLPPRAPGTPRRSERAALAAPRHGTDHRRLIAMGVGRRRDRWLLADGARRGAGRRHGAMSLPEVARFCAVELLAALVGRLRVARAFCVACVAVSVGTVPVGCKIGAGLVLAYRACGAELPGTRLCPRLCPVVTAGAWRVSSTLWSWRPAPACLACQRGPRLRLGRPPPSAVLMLSARPRPRPGGAPGSPHASCCCEPARMSSPWRSRPATSWIDVALAHLVPCRVCRSGARRAEGGSGTSPRRRRRQRDVAFP